KAGGELEFLVLARESDEGAVRALAPQLEALGRQWLETTGAKGVFRVSSRERVARSETTPFLHELAQVHRSLIGPSAQPDAWNHHREAPPIPLQQVTHFLFQRCSGLLFAAQRLQRANFTGEDANLVH